MGNLQKQAKQIAEAIVDLRDEFKAALVSKGVADPGDNMSDYPTKILDIPAGGGASGASGTYRVDWLDYDGAILKTEYVALGGAATPPDTEDLVVYAHDEQTVVARFSGWGVPAAVYGAVLCDMEIMAGYAVEKCAARIEAKAGDVVVLPFVASGADVTVDFGEGTPETITSGNQIQHTYAADFSGVVTFDDTNVNIYNPGSAIPIGNGVAGLFIHASAAFTSKTSALLTDHGFESTTYYPCGLASILTSAPNGRRFACLDSRVAWALSLLSAGNTFNIIDGPSVVATQNVVGDFIAISLPKVFGVYSSDITADTYMFQTCRAPFIYNEEAASLLFNSTESRLYVMAATVECSYCRCLIAPLATTVKALYSSRLYHRRIYAPSCESLEASSVSVSGASNGYLVELTLKNGCAIASIGNIVASYVMSPKNVVAVFTNLPAGTGTISVLNRIFDALSAADKAIATDKGYTVSSVSYLP